MAEDTSDKAENRKAPRSNLRERISMLYWLARHPVHAVGFIHGTAYNIIIRLINIIRAAIANSTIVIATVLSKRPRRLRSVIHVSLTSHKQYMLSRLLRRRGIKSAFLAVNTSKADRLGIGNDYRIPIDMPALRRKLYSMWLLFTVLSRYDVIHYHFNAFLFEDAYDLYFLKRLGKFIVIHFRGCDLRCRSVNFAKNPALNVCQECDYPEGSCDSPYQRARIEFARQYGDLFFVTTPDLLDFFEAAEHMPFTAPVEVDFASIPPLPKSEGVFRVVTSSNHPGLDGVAHIRSAIERLRAEGYPVELLEVIRKPYREVIAAYKSADLFAGKLLMGYYNNANIETMMMGVPNISYIREEYLHKIEPCPIIIARPDTFYDTLKDWLGKPEKLKEIGLQGPAFVARNHSPDIIIDMMIERYNEMISARSSK